MAENYPAMMRKIFESNSQRPMDYLVRNPRAVAAVERYCLPRLDHVLVVVEESGERLQSMGVPPDRISVVSNTPPVARAHQRVDRTRLPGAPLEVVYLGLIEITRGIGEIVAASALLKKAGERVRFRLVGGGRHLEKFREEAAREGLTDAEVDFLGYVPAHEDALRIVAEADVGLIPNHACEHYNTTIPNKLFDYMAASLPVVTSDAIPFARITRECLAGEVFRSKDPADLARVLLRMKDPALRLSYGEAGRAAVLRRYHWEYDTVNLVSALRDTVAASSESPDAAEVEAAGTRPT
jgi:glycosyltransferase involved in cell wall biosynthesis